jgi:hypothetical protein
MSLRTLVGSYQQDTLSGGAPSQKEHVIFAYEAMEQNKAWTIKEMQIWLSPMAGAGGDNRTMLYGCLSTDFLTPPDSSNVTAMRTYARQYNAGDNRGIAWSIVDYANRDSGTNDFRMPNGIGIPFGMIADDRRAINYLILNTLIVSEGDSIANKDSVVNYRIIMEAKKVTPMESIVHQIRGMAQDVDA